MPQSKIYVPKDMGGKIWCLAELNSLEACRQLKKDSIRSIAQIFNRVSKFQNSFSQNQNLHKEKT